MVDHVTIQKDIVPTSSTARVNPPGRKEPNRGQKRFESEMDGRKRKDKSATHLRKDSNAAQSDSDSTQEELPVGGDDENFVRDEQDKGSGSGHGKHIDIRV